MEKFRHDTQSYDGVLISGLNLMDLIRTLASKDLTLTQRGMLRAFIIMAVASMLLTGCGPIDGGHGIPTLPSTPDHSTLEPTPAPTISPIATEVPRTPTVTASPNSSQVTETPMPAPNTCKLKPVDVINKAVPVHEVPNDYSVFTASHVWTEAERNMGRVTENSPSIYEQFKAIQNLPVVQSFGLTADQLVTAPECGFSILWSRLNAKGQRVLIWTTMPDDKGEQVVTRDPGSFVKGGNVFEIPDVGIPGKPQLLVGTDKQLVWLQTVNGKEVIVRVFNQITRVWDTVANEGIRPTEVPLAVQYYFEGKEKGTWKFDIAKVPEITPDDFTSGRLGKAEAALMAEGKIPQFTADTVPYSPNILWYVNYPEAELVMGLKSVEKYPNSPQIRPEDLVTLSKMKLNGTELLVLGVSNKNVDGTVSFLHYAFQDFKDPKFIKLIEHYMEGKYQCTPIVKFQGPKSIVPKWYDYYNQETEMVREYNKDPANRVKLIDEWAKTGNVPDGLTKMLLLGMIFPWSANQMD